MRFWKDQEKGCVPSGTEKVDAIGGSRKGRRRTSRFYPRSGSEDQKMDREKEKSIVAKTRGSIMRVPR